MELQKSTVKKVLPLWCLLPLLCKSLFWREWTVSLCACSADNQHRGERTILYCRGSPLSDCLTRPIPLQLATQNTRAECWSKARDLPEVPSWLKCLSKIDIFQVRSPWDLRWFQDRIILRIFDEVIFWKWFLGSGYPNELRYRELGREAFRQTRIVQAFRMKIHWTSRICHYF